MILEMNTFDTCVENSFSKSVYFLRSSAMCPLCWKTSLRNFCAITILNKIIPDRKRDLFTWGEYEIETAGIYIFQYKHSSSHIWLLNSIRHILHFHCSNTQFLEHRRFFRLADYSERFRSSFILANFANSTFGSVENLQSRRINIALRECPKSR